MVEEALRLRLIRIKADASRPVYFPHCRCTWRRQGDRHERHTSRPAGAWDRPRPPTPALRSLTMLLPLLVGAAIALSPVPEGLPQHAWYYFAIFAAVITGLIVEPIPAAAVGLVGVATAAALARFVLFDPAQLARADFNRRARR